MPKHISLHDALEPLKQALLASRDVIISGKIRLSKLQRVFTLGDGCWLPRNQERAEYGVHLLRDFLFPHVVSQIFIIRFHDVRSWY